MNGYSSLIILLQDSISPFVIDVKAFSIDTALFMSVFKSSQMNV